MFEYIVVSYGYPALFVGAFLEGEIVLVIAGFLSRIGYLNLPWVLAVALVATILADQFYFYLGRRHGREFLAKRPHLQPKVERVHHILHRHQNLIMFGFRFMYQFRIVIPVVLGTSHINAAKFFAYNAIGAVIWTSIFGFGGYIFGNAIEGLVINAKHYSFEIVLGLIFLSVLIWLIMRYFRSSRYNSGTHISHP